MDALLHTIEPWTAAAASALVAASWQGLVLSASIAICLRLLPTLQATGRSLLWMNTFLLVVLLHFAPLASQRTSGSSYASVLRVSPLWAFAVTSAWAALSLYRAIRLGRSAAHLHRIAQRATPVPCGPAGMAALHAGRRLVELCTSHDVDRPSVIGFRTPRILLPPALLADLSASELEQVILHEVEHLRRADDWTNLLQKVILVLFPLNPVLLWIERRLCTERELACDDGVLRRTRARKAYANCLTRLAEHSMLRRGVSLVLGAWERQSELSQRVYRILQHEPEVQCRRAGMVTGLLAFAVLAGAAELAHSPQLIRFAPGAPSIAASANAALDGATVASLVAAPAPVRLVKAVMPAKPVAATRMVRAVQHSRTKPRTTTLPGLRAVEIQYLALDTPPPPIGWCSQAGSKPPSQATSGWLFKTTSCPRTPPFPLRTAGLSSNFNRVTSPREGRPHDRFN